MYETHKKKPLPVKNFLFRVFRHAVFALSLLAISLFFGMEGYMKTEHMDAIDAFLNASMILGGMGPVKTEGLSNGGKLFAGIYALYSGVVFIAVMSIMLAPFIHRIMHRFHWEEHERKNS
jgi:hypothetical protein